MRGNSSYWSSRCGNLFKEYKLVVPMVVVELVVDNRESIKTAVADSVPSSRVAPLELGDYVFNVDGVASLVIERKTLADYAASITDGRHREQKSRLLGTYPKQNVIYLIEGDLTKASKALHHQRVKADTLVSSMFNTMLRDGIHVIHTTSEHETVYILTCLFNKLTKNGLGFITNAKPTHEDNLVASVRSCKRDNMTPVVALKMMLSCIPSVSAVTAARITTRFETMKALVSSLQPLSKDDQIELIKNIKTEKGRKLSKAAAENVILFLGTEQLI